MGTILAIAHMTTATGGLIGMVIGMNRMAATIARHATIMDRRTGTAIIGDRTGAALGRRHGGGPGAAGAIRDGTGRRAWGTEAASSR